VDPSTKQKEFSTVDIPLGISPAEVDINSETVTIQWNHDVPGFESSHQTQLPISLLKSLVSSGSYRGKRISLPRSYWKASEFEQLSDFDFESYMHDESVLLKALRQLHTHGLIFLTNLPESTDSVIKAGERIGPLKTTFYGHTWEVRSVPNAINVAYTSQNLGFHMDLMYMVQPPHLQLLHCMRSSSAGGASLFTDSFRAVDQLSREDPGAFDVLSDLAVDFHYDHPGSQYYHRSRRVIEQEPLKLGRTWVRNYRAAQRWLQHQPEQPQKLSPMDFVEAVSWAPPFQAPFSLRHQPDYPPESLDDGITTAQCLNSHTSRWHEAGQKFNELIHDKEAIYERYMKSGQCVIFDNRRVLHARTAFDVDDAGKERWLRGAYIDKDPFISRLTVLEDDAQRQTESGR
jgi:alpha-ketoglutarate-dependent taurine dioxygenase